MAEKISSTDPDPSSNRSRMTSTFSVIDVRLSSWDHVSRHAHTVVWNPNVTRGVERYAAWPLTSEQ